MSRSDRQGSGRSPSEPRSRRRNRAVRHRRVVLVNPIPRRQASRARHRREGPVRASPLDAGCTTRYGLRQSEPIHELQHHIVEEYRRGFRSLA